MQSERGRPRYFWVSKAAGEGESMGNAVWRNRMVAVVIGLVIGLAAGLALGWMVWPVQYYDTDIADLKVDYQDLYIQMVSEQWQLTQDATQAREALSLLAVTDIPQRLAQAAQRLENGGDSAAARRIQDLMEALGP
jgi:hypothetical protein